MRFSFLLVFSLLFSSVAAESYDHCKGNVTSKDQSSPEAFCSSHGEGWWGGVPTAEMRDSSDSSSVTWDCVAGSRKLNFYYCLASNCNENSSQTLDENGQCECPDGQDYTTVGCVDSCPDGQVRNELTGECGCPDLPQEQQTGSCAACPDGQIRGDDGICACPAGTQMIDGQCRDNCEIEAISCGEKCGGIDQVSEFSCTGGVVTQACVCADSGDGGSGDNGDGNGGDSGDSGNGSGGDSGNGDSGGSGDNGDGGGSGDGDNSGDGGDSGGNSGSGGGGGGSGSGDNGGGNSGSGGDNSGGDGEEPCDPLERDCVGGGGSGSGGSGGGGTGTGENQETGYSSIVGSLDATEIDQGTMDSLDKKIKSILGDHQDEWSEATKKQQQTLNQTAQETTTKIDSLRNLFTPNISTTGGCALGTIEFGGRSAELTLCPYMDMFFILGNILFFFANFRAVLIVIDYLGR